MPLEAFISIYFGFFRVTRKIFSLASSWIIARLKIFDAKKIDANIIVLSRIVYASWINFMYVIYPECWTAIHGWPWLAVAGQSWPDRGLWSLGILSGWVGSARPTWRNLATQQSGLSCNACTSRIHSANWLLVRLDAIESRN